MAGVGGVNSANNATSRKSQMQAMDGLADIQTCVSQNPVISSSRRDHRTSARRLTASRLGTSSSTASRPRSSTPSRPRSITQTFFGVDPPAGAPTAHADLHRRQPDNSGTPPLLVAFDFPMTYHLQRRGRRRSRCPPAVGWELRRCRRGPCGRSGNAPARAHAGIQAGIRAKPAALAAGTYPSRTYL